MLYYNNTEQEVLNELNTSENGLSDEESAARLARNGANKLQEQKHDSIVKKFFMQFADVMVIILIAAAVVSAVVAVPFRKAKPKKQWNRSRR